MCFIIFFSHYCIKENYLKIIFIFSQEKIETPQENSVEDKSLVHEVARSCLKKIAETSVTRKTAAL